VDDTWFEDPKGGCRHDCDDAWEWDDDPDEGYVPGMYVDPVDPDEPAPSPASAVPGVLAPTDTPE
jgi:hypothetical protein